MALTLVKMTKDMQAALESWPACNEFLRSASESEAHTLLHHESRGKRRTQYMLRIYSRFNAERARRERAEVLGGAAWQPV